MAHCAVLLCLCGLLLCSTETFKPPPAVLWLSCEVQLQPASILCTWFSTMKTLIMFRLQVGGKLKETSSLEEKESCGFISSLAARFKLQARSKRAALASRGPLSREGEYSNAPCVFFTDFNCYFSNVCVSHQNWFWRPYHFFILNKLEINCFIYGMDKGVHSQTGLLNCSCHFGGTLKCTLYLLYLYCVSFAWKDCKVSIVQF